MPNYAMDDDPEFWQAPDRFKQLAAFAPEIGAEASYFPMGDPEDDDAPMALVMRMQPGYVITRHTHPCERFEVIVRGSLETGGRTLVAGDVMTAHAWEFYGPKVAGPQGCTTVEVFAKTTGAYLRIVEGEDGAVQTSNLLQDWETALRNSGVPRP
jgi:hypothetical protein